jgi:hypothetical protein
VFIERLITWAEIIRKSYADGAVDEIISTRRLVHISKAFSIFNNRLKSIEMCLNRFDTDTKTAFLDLYTKVDADATAPVASKDGVQVETINDSATGSLTIRVTKNGHANQMVLSAFDMIEQQGSGLTEQQVIDRVAKTLTVAIDNFLGAKPLTVALDNKNASWSDWNAPQF